MANNDLNFNLEDFLASHANDAKQVQVPKKRRSSTKSSSKTKKSTAAKETPDPTEIVEPIKPAELTESAEPTEAEQATPSVEEQTAVISEEIISEQISVDTSADLNQADTVAEEAAQDVPTQDLQSQQSLIEDNQDIAQEITEAESEENCEPAVEAVAESVAETETQKPKDDVWARLEEKFGKLSDDGVETTPAQAFEEPKQSQSALPRYKENTTEIGFSQRRLSDTATVGVRRINRSELSPNETVVGESKHTPTSEELDMQERLRRDREITEKILRRAYAQEEQSSEIGAENSQSSDSADDAEQKSGASANVQIGGRYKQKTKQKKGKKQKQKEQERTLPVLQVGTTDEDDSQNSIMDMLENALDEDIIELEYVSKNNEEPPKYETTPEKKKNKAQTVYFLIGLFFTVMSIIGIVVTAKSTVKFVKDFSDDSKQKQEFAEYIYPVVITDPAAFESVNDLSDEAIIKASLWDIIMYDDGAKYETDASGNMYIPYIQVENHAKALFGTTNIVHSTVAFSQELTFFYDFETRKYKVPVSPQIFPNTPVVTEIEKAGERYTLTVDYQEPTPNWALMDDEYEPGIIKTMEYVLTKYNDGYTIISISSVE